MDQKRKKGINFIWGGRKHWFCFPKQWVSVNRLVLHLPSNVFVCRFPNLIVSFLVFVFRRLRFDIPNIAGPSEQMKLMALIHSLKLSPQQSKWNRNGLGLSKKDGSAVSRKAVNAWKRPDVGQVTDYLKSYLSSNIHASKQVIDRKPVLEHMVKTIML